MFETYFYGKRLPFCTLYTCVEPKAIKMFSNHKSLPFQCFCLRILLVWFFSTIYSLLTITFNRIERLKCESFSIEFQLYLQFNFLTSIFCLTDIRKNSFKLFGFSFIHLRMETWNFTILFGHVYSIVQHQYRTTLNRMRWNEFSERSYCS